MLPRLVIGAALVVLAATPAAAGCRDTPPLGETEIVGSAGAWQAYSFVDGEDRGCFVHSEPQDMQPAGGAPREACMFVTHRPREGTRDVFSVSAGYPFRTGSRVRVTVNGEAFSLVASGEFAWPVDATADRRLVEALRRGAAVTVEGKSMDGAVTTDSYSLEGFAAAYEQLENACPVPSS